MRCVISLSIVAFLNWEICMSKLFINALSMFFLLALSGAAQACPHSEQQFMCPGDPVVDQFGNSGTVAAINPFQKTVAVNYGGSSNNQYDMKTVALGLGCLEGYCVGDSVVDQFGNSGTVSAVNPYNGNVSVNYGGSTNNLYPVDTVALGMGCLQGYCVGDGVVDQFGNSGKIAAINYYNSQVAINYGRAVNNLYNIQTVSTTAYCTTYGDAQRTVPRFPTIDINLYVSADFHFSLQRPSH